MADNVKLVLEFDATGAIKNVQDFGGKLKKETEEASGAFDGLNGKLVAVGSAIAAYFTVGAIKDFFGAIISESMDAEENLNQLNGALKRAGTYSEQSSQAMQDYATAMMNMTTIDDDVILGQLAIARNFTKTDEEARRLVTAAGDLAAAMGTDLGTATELLGRTLDGTAGRLNETVPALRGVSAEALKAGAAIDIVGKAFEGAAANKVKTFEGALQQLGNSFGNLKAAMGDVITQNPIIIAAINELSKLFVFLTGRVSDSKTGVTSWVNEGLLSMISGIRNVLPYLNELMSFLKSISAILIILKDGFMGALDSLVLLGSGIGILIEKFTGGQKSAYLFQATLDDMSKRADKMKEALANIGKDTFSQTDITEMLKALDRISEAAKGVPPVNVKANLNTDNIKKGLSDITAEVAVKKSDEVKAEEYKPRLYDTNSGIGNDVETLLSPIKMFAIAFKNTLIKSLADLTAISQNFANTFNYLSGVITIISASVFNIGDRIYRDIISNSKKVIAAWESTGGIFSPIVSGVAALGAVINSVNWWQVGSILAKAMDLIGTKIMKLSETISSAPITAGVAVAGQATSSVVSNIGKGEAGAKTAIVDTLGAMGAAFDKALGTGNMIGEMLKSFLNTLADPEALKGLIDGFINAIPTIIDSFIEAIPVLMDGIVRALPVLLDGIIRLIPVLMDSIAKGIGPILITLADKLPDIIIAIADNLGPIVEAIVDALPEILTKLIAAIPRVATSLVKAFLGIVWTLISKGIPNIIKGISDGIGRMFKNIGKGISMGGISDFSKQLTGIGKKLFKIFNVDIPKKIWDGVVKLGKVLYVDIPMKLWEGIKKLGQILYVDIPRKIWDGVVSLFNFFNNLGIQIWNQGIMPLVKWFSGIGNQIFSQGIMSLVTWFNSLGMQIWNQGIMPLVTWFNNLNLEIWNKGILPLVTWFANLFTEIWNQGILPLVTWFAGIFTAIWNQGILPLVTWFANVFVEIWNKGILPLVNWFASVASQIWDNGIVPLINFFINLAKAIWDKGILPLVNWIAGLGTTIWNKGILPLVNWIADLGTLIWNQGVLGLVNWFSELGGKLWDAIQSGLGQLTGGGKSGGVLSGIIPGKAKGGIVPSGYPNDTYPALLTSGETVVPGDTSQALFSLINSLASGNGSSGSTNNETNALLRKLIALISSQETTVNVQLDRNVLAKAILTLNKDNRRIA